VPRILRREHEYGLGVIELARDHLHGIGLESVGLEHHRERIAGKRPVGEHVEGGEASAHRSLLASAFQLSWTSMLMRRACHIVPSPACGGGIGRGQTI
jgi:hypothetical protein